MIRPIVIFGNPVLHTKANPVESFDADLEVLVCDMFETMDAARGVGLAAPQIGVSLRVFVYGMENEDGVEPRGVVVNPTITLAKISKANPDPENETEGCLSFPAASFPLKRSPWAKVTGYDIYGNPLTIESTGWFARCMQHEYQHLEGNLYIDHLQDKYNKKAKKFSKLQGWSHGVNNSWLPGYDPDPFGHGED